MCDMKPVVIGFVALVASIIAFNIWARERRVRLTLGSALLLLSYLVLQFSWDLLHMDTRGYEGTAPGPGALAFLFGPVGFIFGIVAIVLLATSRRAVLRRFVAPGRSALPGGDGVLRAGEYQVCQTSGDKA
jgi:hypothetical protein